MLRRNYILLLGIFAVSLVFVYVYTHSFNELYDSKSPERAMGTRQRTAAQPDEKTEKTIGEDTKLTPKKTRKAPLLKRDRLGVVSYTPNSREHLHQFILFLHGSWRHTVKNQETIFNEVTYGKINTVDLLSFCHPKICPQMKHVCTFIKGIKDIKVNTAGHNCYAIEELLEVDIPYPPLNSFIMFNRSDIFMLTTRYKYLLRTDNDVFVTPSLFLLKPPLFLFGQGGYSTEFNNKRLAGIAKKLGLVHKKMHSIGSTWCGKTEFFITVSKKCLELTRYMFVNEFNTTSPDISRFFKTNREGEWPEWWRPVSLLYGGALALNHLLKDISEKNRYSFDATSCDKKSIWKAPHIHCWHSPCKFSKFKFIEYLNSILAGTGTLGADVFHEFVENTYDRDVRNMTLQQYSTFIAWNSLGKYLKNSVL